MEQSPKQSPAAVEPVADLIVEKVKHAVASDSLGELSVADMEAVLASLSQLSTKLENAERERDEAQQDRDRWFETHLAHRDACDALGKANGEMFKRAIEAERRVESRQTQLRAVRADLSDFKDRAESAEQERDELRAKLAEARAAAFEEAAQIAEGPANSWGEFQGDVPERDRIATAIRSRAVKGAGQS